MAKPVFAQQIIDPAAYFHIMGCSLMANDVFRENIIQTMDSFHEHGARISFDPNIRPELLGNSKLGDLVGPGGGYLDKLHTVRYMREERWQPEIWSRQMLQPWLAEGSKLDVDRAREVALDIQSNLEPYEGLSRKEEDEILSLIEKAGNQLEDA